MRRFGMQLLSTMLVLLTVAIASSQVPDMGSKEQADAMQKLAFIAGDWKGTATAIHNGQRFEMTGYEKVSYKAGGCAMLIEAQYKTGSGANERTVHDVAAMIYYDVSKKEYRMLSQLANGMRGEFVIQVKDKGFTWSLKHPQFGDVRYTMTVSSQGEWIEVGERQEAGKWVPVMELRLKKTN